MSPTSIAFLSLISWSLLLLMALGFFRTSLTLAAGRPAEFLFA